jgi:hypothetical protein
MSRSALFIIHSDPRISHRPAEAVRIAAGIGAWQKIKVRLYLHRATANALAETPGEVVDADLFRQYLPLLTGPDQPVYVPTGLPVPPDVAGSPLKFEEISPVNLARMAAQSDFVLHF